MRSWIKTAVGAIAAAALLTVSAAASPLSNVEEIESYDPVRGLTVTESTAEVDGEPQHLMTITADAGVFSPTIGGTASGKSLVNDMTPLGGFGDAPVVAAVNGDHFSFKTGVPLGMSISGGELITSPIPAYDADEYYFHALGITEDGDVLVGENPDLYMQFDVGEETLVIDRINRTREQWEGGQIVLFTPAYGESTHTDVMGTELIVRVEEGEVKAGSTLRGTIVGIDKDGDAPIEEGTVVISAHILRFQEVQNFAEGDEIRISFEFSDAAWNDVVFAVGGNLTIVEEGESLPFNYKYAAFKDPQPRTAFGVKKDGTLVLATADGRSDEAAGMTANEMADYMAYELECEYAILLDGGGSTAMAVADEDGALQTVNVPSEERPVGNGVLLVQTGSGGIGMWGYVIPSVAAVIAALAALAVVLFKGRGKNDRENAVAVTEPTEGNSEK